MGKIEIISASAGSGKTTRIAHVLRERIVERGVRPEAVLATTFTNKAADELKERVRTELFRAGQVEAALRLEGARIGTVNAVCGRLVADYALELGLSPELRVLDEDQSRNTLREVLSRVLTVGEIDRFTDLQRRFSEFEWRDCIYSVLAFARANRIANLEESKARSRDGFLVHLDASTAPDADARLIAAIEGFLSQVDLAVDDTDGTQGVVEECRKALPLLRSGNLKWKDWLKLQKKPRSRSIAIHQPVAAAAALVTAHPRMRDDLFAAVTLVFEIAQRTLDAYAAEKRSWGTLDFVDQEVLALELLKHPEIAKRLSAELDLVLVDEFQDTSPLQLELFSRLGVLAKESVWVGDQKQAIFGFRGTDPALMDAAIGTLLEGKEPETLSTSYRSRPGLVHSVSQLFGDAFAAHGLPRSRVELSPELVNEPAGLGETMEWWALDGKNVGEGVQSLADGVRKLLADETVRVRDRQTGEPRALKPSDVAVLCRRNGPCQALAAELRRHGVSASVHAPGLLSTPERRAAVLALRLFVDSHDRAAAAELALLLEHPHQPEVWLNQVLQRPDGAPFAEAPFHAALQAARERFDAAGPVLALDAAIEAIGLREVIARWGDGAIRLPNLDALRAHAVDYAEGADAEGRAATAAGLVARLAQLEVEGLDRQARVLGDGSVVVSTWHAAKGLEWPVTVLAVLEDEFPTPMFGLTVCSEQPGFDLDAPLKGRWLRFWPNPFHPSNKNTRLHESIEQSEGHQREVERAAMQELRLLYVGMTRARDRLVFATSKGRKYPFSLLDEKLAVPTKDASEVTWGKTTLSFRVRECAPGAPVQQVPEADALPVPQGPTEFPPARLSPSEAEGSGSIVSTSVLGARLLITGQPEMNALGMALHEFLAADRPSFSLTERRELAARCLSNRQVSEALRPEDLLEASRRLNTWAEQVAPKAKWHRELPVSLRQADGAVVRGTADLVLELADGFVLVDHKAYPGREFEKRAAGHAGQLRAYAAALEAAWGKRCKATWIHLPNLAAVLEVAAQ